MIDRGVFVPENQIKKNIKCPIHGREALIEKEAVRTTNKGQNQHRYVVLRFF